MSCESDDSEYDTANSDMDEDDLLQSDAINAKESVSIRNLTSEDIEVIDRLLELSDKISLVFLLYNNAHTGLQQIILLLQNAQINVVEDWYRHEKKRNDKWNEKLLEALTIIQNYAVLRELGFKKIDMASRYLPLRAEVCLQVDRIRKHCFRVCEDFKRTRTKLFLDYLEDDVENLKCMPQNEKEMYSMDYLEMYFLFLEGEKYISANNIKNLANILKKMDLLNLHDKFISLHETISKERSSIPQRSANYNVDRIPGEFLRSPSCSKEMEEVNENEENQAENADDIYEIDPELPGILLIINNERFYTDYREEIKHRLPNTHGILENRNGSEEDKRKLQETFKKLKFHIEIKENLTDTKIIEELKMIVNNFVYSCLFVAILTHGDQGIVYGANSVSIEVTEIQRLICDNRLRGKPKVLLLQSCQGNDCQKINDDDYATDGPKKFVPPKTTDLLTFRATIPGYSAVRHITRGTWFIQEFCKAMEEYSNYHVHDICTKVIAKVSNKLWGEKCMVPLIEHTFTKRLYLKIGNK
ncbi:Peptidase [Oryctes borbonicus]|uniref:Peptidase n=1 Tax=Oryctes borbonicus TaxID=1629725 RepID=A0A0T6AWY1_9SCAR|nr:Peptidase [Oryctes borbonicus]